MATKIKSVFFCQSCGYESSKWMGQCPGCREWNTFVEETVKPTAKATKGVSAVQAINNYANELIRDWLIKPVPYINEEGNEIVVPNLMFIKSRGLLKELIAFNPIINVDRVRALGMVMLYREEKMILYQGDMAKAKEAKTEDDGENDDFFKINYDDRFTGN